MKNKLILVFAVVLGLLTFAQLAMATEVCTCDQTGGRSADYGGSYPYNHFTCRDGGVITQDRHCATWEECTGTSVRPNWPCQSITPTPSPPYYPQPYYPQYYTICTPWTTQNRFCACSTQVAYYRCNAYGTNWDYIVENCPYGSTCSNGQCGYQPQCTAGYTGNYRCSNNWSQGEYRNSDCSTTWNNVEYCSNGCSNGQCNRCSEQYLDNWQCNGNWIQRKFQYSDCSIYWQNYEYCPNGCFGGTCGSACTEGYLNSYRCDGNWKQQLYQNSDCSLSWASVEYCSDGCYDNYCRIAAPCDLSVSASTPRDVYLDDTIDSTIEISNSGDRGAWVSFTAYVCRSDGTNCMRMDCDGNDPSFHLDGHDSRSFTCSRTADETSWHKIKVQYSGCYHTYDPVVYSGRFEVLEKRTCDPGFQNNYRCSDKWKQQLYTSSDCTTEWRNVEYCSEGCSGNKCIVKPKESIPKVILDDEYEVKACQSNDINFDVMNTGDKADTFTISYSGAAADWISSTREISLDAGERKAVTAYVSVPCDASDLQHFTVKMSNTQTTSATSFFKVSGIPFTGWFVWNGRISDIVMWGLIFLLVVGVLLILVLFFVWALSGKNRNGRERPESFNHFLVNISRKVPESFNPRC